MEVTHPYSYYLNTRGSWAIYYYRYDVGMNTFTAIGAPRTEAIFVDLPLSSGEAWEMNKCLDNLCVVLQRLCRSYVSL